MNKPTSKISSYKDLLVWQKGHLLVLNTYKACTRFPREELYSLTDQMKRAAVSITSNIAEGFGRQTMKEKLQFFYTSKGSLSELENQILIAKDLTYLPENEYQQLTQMTDETHRLLNGLIKATRLKIAKRL